MSNTNKDANKVTIYCRSEFGMGICKIEARLVEHGTRPCAQYASVPFVTYRPKRARKDRQILQATRRPSLLIVKGWNAPDPDSMWDESTRTEGNGVSSVRGRYSACDPRWQADFDAMMARQDVEIVADYRGHEVGYR